MRLQGRARLLASRELLLSGNIGSNVGQQCPAISPDDGQRVVDPLSDEILEYSCPASRGCGASLAPSLSIAPLVPVARQEVSGVAPHDQRVCVGIQVGP